MSERSRYGQEVAHPAIVHAHRGVRAAGGRADLNTVGAASDLRRAGRRRPAGILEIPLSGGRTRVRLHRGSVVRVGDVPSSRGRERVFARETKLSMATPICRMLLRHWVRAGWPCCADDARQDERRQDGDNADDDQQLDQREPGLPTDAACSAPWPDEPSSCSPFNRTFVTAATTGNRVAAST